MNVYMYYAHPDFAECRDHKKNKGKSVKLVLFIIHFFYLKSLLTLSFGGWPSFEGLHFAPSDIENLRRVYFFLFRLIFI